MKKIMILMSCLIFLIGINNARSDGEGQIKLGYSIVDHEGNQSVNQATFNQYEGFSLSLERFRYKFDNGMYLDANLKRVTLNNRNLNLSIRKPRLYGVKLFNNQYRRTYDFDGANFTRRHRTGASLWYNPHKYVKIFGDANFVGESGNIISLYDPGVEATPMPVDYSQKYYNIGARFNYQGRMFQAEYRGGTTSDKENADRDRTRNIFRLIGIAQVPEYQWIILSGGFQRFDSKYDNSDFSFSSNRVWGGITIDAPKGISVNYNFIFDRASSDSDYVATDNIAHTIYLSYNRPNYYGLTVGYQNHINDDFEDEINSDSYYLSGWLRPSGVFEFRGEYGNRAEKVNDGYRLTGQEDRHKFKIVGTYKYMDIGSVKVGYDGKRRKNESIASEEEFNRVSIGGNLKLEKWGEVICGYSFSSGEYKNMVRQFKYDSHVLNGNIAFNEYRDVKLILGGVYYRSKCDLDVESFRVNLDVTYKFMKDYSINLAYNVDNFDDFLVRDQYYTSNIVELNLIKDISL